MNGDFTDSLKINSDVPSVVRCIFFGQVEALEREIMFSLAAFA
jgi:hypothetical protein